jgi:hypothetical protein
MARMPPSERYLHQLRSTEETPVELAAATAGSTAMHNDQPCRGRNTCRDQSSHVLLIGLPDLSSLAIAVVVVLCCCTSAVIGIVLHIKLPAHHFDNDSKDVVKSVMGIVATMVALVLSLLIASAKSSYDTQSTELEQLGTNVVQLDQLLVLYGPETKDARAVLRQAIAAAHDRIWPEDKHLSGNLDTSMGQGYIRTFVDMVEHLSPTTDAQRRAQSSALQMVGSLTHARMLMFEQSAGSISWPLLVVLISWVSVLFAGFGLFARVHAVVVGALIIGALSVASAIFLILELSEPYAGFMRISDAAFQAALVQMSH